MNYYVGQKVKHKEDGTIDEIVSFPGVIEYDTSSFNAAEKGFVLKTGGWEFQDNWEVIGFKAGDKVRITKNIEPSHFSNNRAGKIETIKEHYDGNGKWEWKMESGICYLAEQIELVQPYKVGQKIKSLDRCGGEIVEILSVTDAHLETTCPRDINYTHTLSIETDRIELLPFEVGQKVIEKKGEHSVGGERGDWTVITKIYGDQIWGFWVDGATGRKSEDEAWLSSDRVRLADEEDEDCTHDISSPGGNCAACGESTNEDQSVIVKPYKFQIGDEVKIIKDISGENPQDVGAVGIIKTIHGGDKEYPIEINDMYKTINCAAEELLLINRSATKDCKCEKTEGGKCVNCGKDLWEDIVPFPSSDPYTHDFMNETWSPKIGDTVKIIDVECSNPFHKDAIGVVVESCSGSSHIEVHIKDDRKSPVCCSGKKFELVRSDDSQNNKSEGESEVNKKMQREWEHGDKVLGLGGSCFNGEHRYVYKKNGNLYAVRELTNPGGGCSCTGDWELISPANKNMAFRELSKQKQKGLTKEAYALYRVGVIDECQNPSQSAVVDALYRINFDALAKQAQADIDEVEAEEAEEKKAVKVK